MTATENNGQRSEDGESRSDELRRRADAETRASLSTLSEGPRIPLIGAPLPLRSVAAITIFAVVFLLTYLAVWTLLGGFGLFLGLLIAPAAAAGAVHLYARSRA